jgi:hypothetical protein
MIQVKGAEPGVLLCGSSRPLEFISPAQPPNPNYTHLPPSKHLLICLP